MDHKEHQSLDLLFKPRNIAIFEAKYKFHYFIRGFIKQGFNKENLYLISPTETELFDIKCYESIEKVPAETIDLFILAVRREIIVQTMKEILESKKVNFFHIFTAGMGEADNFGVEIEKGIKGILDNKEIYTRATGPNGMGVYCPSGKNSYHFLFPVESGNIASVFHSGDLNTKLIRFGALRYDLRFSKSASIGNCIDLQISDFLDYYNQDDETDIICVYFEGFSRFHKEEGQQLFRALKKMQKPVLFINGGTTDRAQTAVLSHTGSIATQQNIWDAVIKQTPTIKVDTSLDEMVDFAYMFYYFYKKVKKKEKEGIKLTFPKGKNALVILWSGGFGILATDSLTKLGLNMPLFEGKIKEKLMEIFPLKIGSYSNPLDLPWITYTDKFYEICKTAISENIDLVVIESDAPDKFDGKWFKGYYENLIKIKDYMDANNKVLIIILHEYPDENREGFYKMLKDKDFLIYPTIQRAAKSYLALYEYGLKRKKYS
jgi:acyl-CoA synthetase (NDP forming)